MLKISFTDLHIYNNHISAVEKQLRRIPYELPRLQLNSRLLNSGLEGLLSCNWDDITLTGYRHHPKISAEVAV